MCASGYKEGLYRAVLAQTTRTLGNPAIRLSIEAMQFPRKANGQEGLSHNPRSSRESPTKAVRAPFTTLYASMLNSSLLLVRTTSWLLDSPRQPRLTMMRNQMLYESRISPTESHSDVLNVADHPRRPNLRTSRIWTKQQQHVRRRSSSGAWI
jgi:hypothetical protein